jgi:UDP-glucuronate 4-epimerase
MAKTIFVTGAAGFIGSHLVQALLMRGDYVVGLDNLNDYYDPARKRANLAEVEAAIPRPKNFTFVQGDIRDRDLVGRLYAGHSFDVVVHLAAMAGIRGSVENPQLYYDVNLNGTLVLLEGAVGRLEGRTAQANRPTFVFGATSSAYGGTRQIPFVETIPCNEPLAPYAASKLAAELLGFSYHRLYRLPFTALRFFNVYGPRGRPDMMPYKLLDNIFFNREVPLYNEGQSYRDWTFVDDIVKGVVAAVDRPLGYQIINLGRGNPVLLADFVKIFEDLIGQKANLTPAPMPDSDILYTYADVTKAHQLLGYQPRIQAKEGVERFWNWYEVAVLGQVAQTTAMS